MEDNALVRKTMAFNIKGPLRVRWDRSSLSRFEREAEWELLLDMNSINLRVTKVVIENVRARFPPVKSSVNGATVSPDSHFDVGKVCAEKCDIVNVTASQKVIFLLSNRVAL